MLRVSAFAKFCTSIAARFSISRAATVSWPFRQRRGFEPVSPIACQHVNIPPSACDEHRTPAARRPSSAAQISAVHPSLSVASKGASLEQPLRVYEEVGRSPNRNAVASIEDFCRRRARAGALGYFCSVSKSRPSSELGRHVRYTSRPFPVQRLPLHVFILREGVDAFPALAAFDLENAARSAVPRPRLHRRAALRARGGGREAGGNEPRSPRSRLASSLPSSRKIVLRHRAAAPAIPCGAPLRHSGLYPARASSEERSSYTRSLKALQELAEEPSAGQLQNSAHQKFDARAWSPEGRHLRDLVGAGRAGLNDVDRQESSGRRTGRRATRWLSTPKPTSKLEMSQVMASPRPVAREPRRLASTAMFAKRAPRRRRSLADRERVKAQGKTPAGARVRRGRGSPATRTFKEWSWKHQVRVTPRSRAATPAKRVGGGERLRRRTPPPRARRPGERPARNASRARMPSTERRQARATGVGIAGEKCG